MRVRLTVHGPVTDDAGNSFQAYPGLEVDLTPEEAIRLIDSGQAVAVAEAAEAAAIEASERAVLPAGRSKKRS